MDFSISSDTLLTYSIFNKLELDFQIRHRSILMGGGVGGLAGVIEERTRATKVPIWPCDYDISKSEKLNIYNILIFR